MVVDGGDIYLSRLGRWVLLIIICVTNGKDSHKVQISIMTRYCVELQVLDISIVSKRLEMMTQCAQLIPKVSNDYRLCTHFVTVQL